MKDVSGRIALPCVGKEIGDSRAGAGGGILNLWGLDALHLRDHLSYMSVKQLEIWCRDPGKGQVVDLDVTIIYRWVM